MTIYFIQILKQVLCINISHTKKTKRQNAGRYTKVKMTFFNLLGRLNFFPLHISLLSFFVVCFWPCHMAGMWDFSSPTTG